MIIADESLNGRFIKALRKNGMETLAISESFSGYQDFEIITLAREQASIIITEDKDFGEWVFAHDVKDITVIFLRYKKLDESIILGALLKIVPTVKSEDHIFITISKNKIRKRKT